MDYKKERRIILFFSLGLFLLSLIQETYCVNDNCNTSASGFLCLALGWAGVLYGGAALCWLANPLLIISWILVKKKVTSIIICGLSMVFMLSFLIFNEIVVDENGHFGQITNYRSGYWTWLLSSVSFFIGNMWIIYKTKTELSGTNTN